MKNNILLSLAACCVTGALGFYAGSRFTSTTRSSIGAVAQPVPASLRIALVDMRRLLESHPQTSASKSRIRARRADASAELQDLMDSGDHATATAFRETRTKDIEAESVRLRTQIATELQMVVKNHAAAQAFDLVLDRSGNSLNNVPVVLYATRITDVTEDILRQIKH